jgi:hypothetical protein
MSEPIKFTEEETNQLNGIKTSYQNIQFRFGEFALYRLKVEEDYEALNKLEENLRKEYKGVQENENKFVTGLTDKYGTGQLNPETGIFTPDKSSKVSETSKKK